MAQYTTEAIIVGVKNWQEADKMLTLFSPDKGKISALAFGCRRPKNNMAGALQLFNVIEVTLNKGERVDTIRQCTLKHQHKPLVTDFDAMAYASFVAELVTEIAIEDFPQVEMYRRLRQIFVTFGNRNPRIIALAAAFQLLDSAGFIHPECATGEAGEYPEEVNQFIVQLIHMDWELENKFKISGKVLMMAEQIMLENLHEILEHPLKSLEFLKQL